MIASVVVGLIVLEPLIFLPITAVFVLLGLPTWCFLKKKPYWGFLFMVSFILLLPLFSFVSTIIIPKLTMKRRSSPDKNMVVALRMALEIYESDFHAYPPLEPFQNSSAALLDALTQRSKPYIVLIPSIQIAKLGNETAFVSQSGNPLMYMPIQRPDGNRGFVLVFPGRDRLIGGKLSLAEGFVPDNSDANGDGILDHVDNIIEQVPKD